MHSAAHRNNRGSRPRLWKNRGPRAACGRFVGAQAGRGREWQPSPGRVIVGRTTNRYDVRRQRRVAKFMEKTGQEIGGRESAERETSGENATPEGRKPIREPSRSAASPQPGEKGSLLSLWEILLQLRVLLPYLSRLVPLLDRGLIKSPPELPEIRKTLAEMQVSLRDWGSRAKIQADQLDRIEAEMSQLLAENERYAKQSRELAEGMWALSSRLLLLTVILSVLLAALILLQILRWVHPGS